MAGNRQIRGNQQGGGFLETEGHTVVKQAHAGIFFYNGVEVVAAVVKRALQLRAGHTAVGVLHQMADPGEQYKVVFAAELYRQDMKRFRVGQIVKKFKNQPPNHAVSSQTGEKQRAGQPVGNPVQVGGMLAVKGTGGIRFLLQISIDREKVQIVFLGIRADIFFHKREDRVGGGNDWAGEEGCAALRDQLPDKVDGQAEKQDRSLSEKALRVRNIAVDQTAGPGA